MTTTTVYRLKGEAIYRITDAHGRPVFASKFTGTWVRLDANADEDEIALAWNTGKDLTLEEANALYKAFNSH